ncbi:unnamed protein product [Ceratitis capitata]|uniref:(Mediterranean fruit fly) hypothetical protein n=1 Tax=Ceratitis capitata TaxID=7213 RepID=A0A811VC80_CERCA|nr:unnamed protein product [Ceratitis capitata]
MNENLDFAIKTSLDMLTYFTGSNSDASSFDKFFLQGVIDCIWLESGWLGLHSKRFLLLKGSRDRWRIKNQLPVQLQLKGERDKIADDIVWKSLGKSAYSANSAHIQRIFSAQQKFTHSAKSNFSTQHAAMCSNLEQLRCQYLMLTNKQHIEFELSTCIIVGAVSKKRVLNVEVYGGV